MWIFTSNGFLSIVAHREKPEHLMVRARREGEIESVFPNAAVVRTDNADYLFRATIHREDVAEAVASQARNLEYDNFKNSVHERERHNAYMDVWTIMNSYQRRMDPRHLSYEYDPFAEAVGPNCPGGFEQRIQDELDELNGDDGEYPGEYPDGYYDQYGQYHLG